MTVLRLALVLVSLLVAPVLVGAAVVVLGLRARSARVRRLVRRMNRRVTNPRVMRHAGEPGRAGVIEHRGRVTGRAHRTPVDPIPVDGGFLVALPYGDQTEWLRNVLAGGGGRIHHDGSITEVVEPEVVSTSSVAAELPAGQRRTLHAFRVDRCLRVRSVVS